MTQSNITDKLRNLNHYIGGYWFTISDLGIDLSDGKNFTTMEWLMVFVKVPL